MNLPIIDGLEELITSEEFAHILPLAHGEIVGYRVPQHPVGRHPGQGHLQTQGIEELGRVTANETAIPDLATESAVTALSTRVSDTENNQATQQQEIDNLQTVSVVTVMPAVGTRCCGSVTKMVGVTLVYHFGPIDWYLVFWYTLIDKCID